MLDKRQDMLATEKIGRLLFRLSMPAAIAAAVMGLYNVVDTIFIGQIVGPLGIAGLAIVFPIQIIGMGMGQMIGIGGASLVSRTLGAGDIDKAERTLGNSIFFSVVIGLVVTIVGLSNSGFWLRLVGASETVLPYAKAYFDVILIGMLFRICAMGLSQLIRAEGNARVAMMCMVVGFALNIVLDAVFVLALDMGVRGAAIATVISEAVTTLYVFHYYLFRDSSLKIRVKNLIPERHIMREIMVIGFGPFVMTTGGSIVAITVNKLLVSYGGDMAVASFGMVHRSMTFIFIPIMSIGQGLQPILGYSYGAKQIDRALQAIKLSIIVATIFAVISFLIIFFFPEPIMRVFTQDSELLAASSHAARLMFLTAYLIGFQMTGMVVFQALGKAIPTFLATTSRQILFLFPLLFILPKFWQLDGIWLSVPVADALAFVLTLVLFIFQIRKLKRADYSVETAKLPPVAGQPGEMKLGGYIGGIKTEEQADIDRY
jgi:putative MATE family efflux protein